MSVNSQGMPIAEFAGISARFLPLELIGAFIGRETSHSRGTELVNTTLPGLKITRTENRAHLTYGTPGFFGNGVSKIESRALQGLLGALQRVKLQLLAKVAVGLNLGSGRVIAGLTRLVCARQGGNLVAPFCFWPRSSA
jgi:hypothetical protein